MRKDERTKGNLGGRERICVSQSLWFIYSLVFSQLDGPSVSRLADKLAS